MRLTSLISSGGRYLIVSSSGRWATRAIAASTAELPPPTTATRLRLKDSRSDNLSSTLFSTRPSRVTVMSAFFAGSFRGAPLLPRARTTRRARYVGCSGPFTFLVRTVKYLPPSLGSTAWQLSPSLMSTPLLRITARHDVRTFSRRSPLPARGSGPYGAPVGLKKTYLFFG